MVQFDLESQIRGQAEPHLSARDRGADVVQAGGERRRKRQSIHQADVFYDLDAAGTVAGAAVSLVHFGPGSLFFLRAQKPLPFDISGKGVERGYRADWDNIHPGHPSGGEGSALELNSPGLYHVELTVEHIYNGCFATTFVHVPVLGKADLLPRARGV
ncbi:MAG TPA: hypothetical protein VJV79_09670 [Polyangiaceae bacterium]|nr:hypothetical protein [Polyangiaceae bacterium]